MTTLGLFSTGSSGDGTNSPQSTSKQSLRSELENPEDEEDGWGEGWGDDDESLGSYGFPTVSGLRHAQGVLPGSNGGNEFEKTSDMKEVVILYLLKKQLQDRDVDDNRFLGALHNLHHVGILSLETIRNARTAMDSPRGGGVDSLIRSIVPLRDKVDALPSTRFLSDFTPLKVLGEGGYGTVIKARHNLDNTVYAVKQIPFEIPGDSPMNVLENPVFREVQALTKLTQEYPHPFICRYHTVWVENGYHPVGGTEQTSPLGITETSQPALPAPAARPHSDTPEAAGLAAKPHSEVYDGVFLPGDATLLPGDATLLPGDDVFLDEEDDHEPGTLAEAASLKGLNRSAFLIGDHWATTKMQRTLFLQMEYCGEDTLKTYIESQCWENNLGLFAKLVLAVQYIHAHGFIHRDLKPENVCVNDKKIVKVTDFGLTRVAWRAIGGRDTDDLGMSHGVGTRGYTAPEVEAATGDYGQAADIYSLGIILWEILCGAHGGFETGSERQEALSKLLEGRPDPRLFENDEAATELVLRMVQPNPENRPTITDIISTAWFQHLEPELLPAARAAVLATPTIMAPVSAPPASPASSPMQDHRPMHRGCEPPQPPLSPRRASPAAHAVAEGRDDCKDAREDSAGAETAYLAHMRHESVRRQHSSDPDFKKMLAASLREELRQLELQA